MPARSRVWKVGVLKAPRLPLGLRKEKEDMVRQLDQLHTRKDIDKGKKKAADDLDDAVMEMKELREEMTRRGMHF